jgi:hypothetical protein
MDNKETALMSKNKEALAVDFFEDWPFIFFCYICYLFWPAWFS